MVVIYRKNENEIYSLIHSFSQLTGEDWDCIEFFINQSQNNFAQKLRNDYPILSEDDIHIILLVRMGLNNKEIASSCSILLSSYRTRRSRLKKKMGIECESVSAFIKMLYKNKG